MQRHFLDIWGYILGIYPGRQVTSSCEIASTRIQGLETYFKINKQIKQQEKESIIGVRVG